MRWLVIVALAMTLRSPAWAAPQVDVRARTQVSIDSVRLRDARTIEVIGQLSDKATGAGLPHQAVTIRIGDAQVTAITREDGSFSAPLGVAPGQHEVSVSAEFPGSGRLDPADSFTLQTDAAKAQVQLAIVKTRDDPSGARLRVDATSQDRPLAAPVELALAPVAGEAWRVVGTAEAGAELLLTRAQAGGAGIYRIRARYAGDPVHQAADTVVTTELASGSTTTMALSARALAFEDTLVATGSVVDDDGAPLARAAVTLRSGDRRLAQATTDDRGRYRFAVEAEVVGHGQFGLQVQADPGLPYLQGSRSEPALVRIAPPQPVPVSYTIVAFLAAVLAAGGFVLARTRPWRALARPRPPAEVPRARREVDLAEGGLVTARPGMVATLRRPHDAGFAGVVRDAARGRPLGDATVVLALGDATRAVRTAADGSFAVEGLASGAWRAEVSAAGHVSERFEVSVPHRGELRGARVDLVPVRERVFQLYRRAGEPALPQPRLWGIWSPRQIVDHVSSAHPSPALDELTRFVEEIYFSGRLYEEAVVAQAEAWVDAAVAEREGAPRT